MLHVVIKILLADTVSRKVGAVPSVSFQDFSSFMSVTGKMFRSSSREETGEDILVMRWGEKVCRAELCP